VVPFKALYKCTKIPSQRPLQMYQDSLSTPFTNVPRLPLNALYKCTKIPSQRPLQMYQDSLSTPLTNVPRFPLNALNKCTKIPSQRPLQMYQDSLSTPFTNIPRFIKFLSLVIELSPGQDLKVQINKGNNSFRWIMVHMQYTSSQCPLRLY